MPTPSLGAGDTGKQGDFLSSRLKYREEMITIYSWGHMTFWRKAKEGFTEGVSLFLKDERSPVVFQTEGLLV